MQFGGFITILYIPGKFARTRLISLDSYRDIGSPHIGYRMGHKIELKGGITNSRGSIYYKSQKLPDPFRLTGLYHHIWLVQPPTPGQHI